MNALKHVVTELINTDETLENKIENLFAFLENNSYIDDELDRAMLFARQLKKLSEAIEEHYFDSVLERLEKLGKVEYEEGSISVVNREQYTFLDDSLLNKYQEDYEEVNTKLKKLRASIKNRQEALIEEGKAIKEKSKTTIRIDI